jgi:ABC-type siderophore export system fused ATPase/permease subunit
LSRAVRRLKKRFAASRSKVLARSDEQGATICLVTHAQHYSEFAERTIHLLDGHIVETTTENAKAV